MRQLLVVSTLIILTLIMLEYMEYWKNIAELNANYDVQQVYLGGQAIVLMIACAGICKIFCWKKEISTKDQNAELRDKNEQNNNRYYP